MDNDLHFLGFNTKFILFATLFRRRWWVRAFVDITLKSSAKGVLITGVSLSWWYPCFASECRYSISGLNTQINIVGEYALLKTEPL